MTSRMKTYTVFCRQKNRTGTTWIDNVQAATPKAAQKRAVLGCASDWLWDKARIECSA